MKMDIIEYKIGGRDMQYVETVLDPGEAAIGEAGAMMMMDDGIRMETLFGDGSDKPAVAKRGGLYHSRRTVGASVLKKLVGSGKRLLTGESLFITVFHNASKSRKKVAFAAPYPGSIMPVELKEMGGEFICQKDAFLCAARGVSLDIAIQRKISTALFGGEGFIMQRLIGDGMAFVHAGGALVERKLRAGETIRIDTGCIVGYEPGVDFDIEYVGSLKSALFSGEGLFLSRLRGPGRVWLQSLPISRLAGRVMAYLPASPG